MVGMSLGFKKKMKITSCNVSASGSVSEGSSSFEVMINPASVNVTHGICYSGDASSGSIGSEQKFSKRPPDKVKFDIIIDGTGVVNLPVPGLGSDDVKTQIQNLKKVIYDYQGAKHETPVVKLLWGSFIFFGRLESLSVDYTLFKPGGDPLRAKVNLNFSGFMSNEEEAKRKNNQSPDMTHIIEVKASDTLPALCEKVYGDSGWYLEVARINHLVNFRQIPSGTRLRFPPLR
ncbi:MAG: hypothetical protein MI742_13340 [Desulfobacterales bacterium]|nr:hypothetical protein [Desulfobacterales bacterium]